MEEPEVGQASDEDRAAIASLPSARWPSASVRDDAKLSVVISQQNNTQPHYTLARITPPASPRAYIAIEAPPLSVSHVLRHGHGLRSP